MSRTITFNLTEQSVRNAIRELQAEKAELLSKTQKYVSRLADVGIQTAKSNVGNYGRYITFSSEFEPTTTGCKGVFLATETGKIVSKWQTSDGGVKTADVSQLLMTEFGAGHKAQNPKNVPGVGQGTFPGQTHANDPSGWYWVDMDGNLQHSYGVTPTMPVYKAFLEMEQNIFSIAKEVFG